MRHRFRYVTIAIWIALLAPVLIEISAFRTSHLWSQQIWFTPQSKHRFEYYILAFAVISTGFALFARRYFLPFLVSAVVLCSVAAIGLRPVGAVLLFLFSATILGNFGVWPLAQRFPRLHGRNCHLDCCHDLRRTLSHPLSGDVFGGAGCARDICLSALAPVGEPVDQSIPAKVEALERGIPWLYVIGAAAGRGLADGAGAGSQHGRPGRCIWRLRRTWRSTTRSPSISASLIWALMPMGADWCYSVVYILGGEYAARLLNFAMLGTIGLLLFGVARRFVLERRGPADGLPVPVDTDGSAGDRLPVGRELCGGDDLGSRSRIMEVRRGGCDASPDSSGGPRQGPRPRSNSERWPWGRDVALLL